LGLAVAAALLVCVPAHATSTFVIDPTFSSSITSDPGAAAIEGAINAAIMGIEASITSANNLTVSIYFTEGGGLGESLTGEYLPTYDQYYNAFKAVATQPDALAALVSLGPAPGPSSDNPVDSNTGVVITSAEGRNLGFNTPGVILPNSNIADATGGGTYDAEIALNTSITYPPGPNNGSNYGLQAVANHEIDETLGIGGTGSTLNGTGSLTGAVGDLDLYRYSCPGGVVGNTCSAPVRSYSNTNSTVPDSYFSIDGGKTVLSYFSETDGADFADWLSNCTSLTACTDGLPNGFGPQVQDAFGEGGTDPTLGPNELAAFNAIGYQLISTTPEPSTFALVGAALLGAGFLRRRLQARKNG
jgi:hypothetical protein